MRFTKRVLSQVYIRLASLFWGDLALIVGGAAILLVLIGVGERISFLAAPRVILAALYLLFAPGYCLAAALFPRRADLDDKERLGLSLGLSLALVAILAPILDNLPSGIHLWPIMVAEYSATMAFISLAIWRRARLPTQEVYIARPFERLQLWWSSLSTSEHRLMLLSSGLLLLALSSLTWITLVPSPKSFMTEFYVLGPEGMAEGYQAEALPGEQVSATVGITNRERDERTYDIEIWVVNPWNPEYSVLVGRVGAITLSPGQSYEQPVSWRMPGALGDQQVELRLLDGKSITPYRTLRLWIEVLSPSSAR
ncbi:MAG: DUF1616 domain-containing protein [Chloroflexi bacterium]|jgi:uncharacterized membrane protein|nr:DUF1616 domain-containing protein [Chloroflexota bacterium]